MNVKHDASAERKGISRRTTCRHFVDRRALLGTTGMGVRELASANETFLDSKRDLLDTHAI